MASKDRIKRSSILNVDHAASKHESSHEERKKKLDDDLFLKQFIRDEPDYFKNDHSFRFFTHLNYLFESQMEATRNQVIFFVFNLLFIAFVCGSTFYSIGGLYGSTWREVSMSEAVWQSWSIIMDPGLQFNAVEQPNRVIAGFTTIIGVMFAATLTGFVVDAVKQKLDRFRAGLVGVQEWEHTVLIGWTDRSIGFINQICIANKESGGTVIVVLAEQDKLQMEREFHSTVSFDDLRGSKVIFRSGNPQRIPSLHLAAVPAARVTVIMSMGSGSYDADATTLRIIVALTVVGVKEGGYIVAEVRDPEFDTVIKFTGGPQLETIQSNDMNARVSLSAVKQPGVTRAFEEIIGFEGDEFYAKIWPEVAGKQFDLMSAHFPDCIPIGVKTIEGDVTLCPLSDYVMKPTDALVVLAEDSQSYVYSPNPPAAATVAPGMPPDYKLDMSQQRKILVCGWGENLRVLLRMLSEEFEIGTEVHLFNRVPIKDRRTRLAEEIGIEMCTLEHLEVTHILGDPSQWRTLSALNLDSYHCVLVVSDDNIKINNSASSDSQNLASILMLRHHDLIVEHHLTQEKAARMSTVKHHDGKEEEEEVKSEGDLLSTEETGVGLQVHEHVDLRKNQQAIFVEIQDTQTQELIEAHSYLAEACRFLVSNRLISKVIAMVAEDRTVRKILDLLLGGNTVLSLVPSELFVENGERASFFVVARRARMKRHIIIGYQHKLRHTLTSLNPKDKGVVRKWDQVTFIVLTRAPQARKSTHANTHKLETYKERFSLDEFNLEDMGILPKTDGGDHADGEVISPLLLQSSFDVAFSLNEGLGFRLYGGDEHGLVVSGVTPGGQAQCQGLQPGYRITALDGVPMNYQEELLSLVERSKEAGSTSVVISFVEPLEGEQYGDDGGMEEELMARISQLEAQVLQLREEGASTVFQISEAFNAAKKQYEEKIRSLEAALKETAVDDTVQSRSEHFSESRRGSGSSNNSSTPRKAPPPRGESEPRSIGSRPVTSRVDTKKSVTTPTSGRTNGSFTTSKDMGAAARRPSKRTTF